MTGDKCCIVQTCSLHSSVSTLIHASIPKKYSYPFISIHWIMNIHRILIILNKLWIDVQLTYWAINAWFWQYKGYCIPSKLASCEWNIFENVTPWKIFDKLVVDNRPRTMLKLRTVNDNDDHQWVIGFNGWGSGPPLNWISDGHFVTTNRVELNTFNYVIIELHLLVIWCISRGACETVTTPIIDRS